MIRNLIWALFVLTVLPFTGCDDDDDGPTSISTVKGSGVMTTAYRSVGDFNSVEMNMVGQITITSGASNICSLTVDDNILQYIQTSVSGNRLVIFRPHDVSLTDYDLTVKLTMTDLEAIDLNGVGTVTSLNQFVADDVSVSVDGVGSVNLDLNVGRLTSTGNGVFSMVLTGSAGKHTCTMEADAFISSFNFLTDTTVIILEGAGNAEVTAFRRLDVTISGSGSVYYKGYPTINTVITGSGQVIDSN